MRLSRRGLELDVLAVRKGELENGLGTMTHGCRALQPVLVMGMADDGGRVRGEVWITCHEEGHHIKHPWEFRLRSTDPAVG